MIDAHRSLVKAGLLPEEMPDNYTFNKVRRILSEIAEADPSELNRAIARALEFEISGPLAALIFIKHHLLGPHEVEVDRLINHEEQNVTYGVLIYPEGELSVNTKYLPDDAQEGSRLQYDPTYGAYKRLIKEE